MSEIIIKGTYADAKVFTVNDESRAVEQYALAQIRIFRVLKEAYSGSAKALSGRTTEGRIGLWM